MLTKSDIKKLLDENGISPKKSLGQNFLIDNNINRFIVKSLDLRPSDAVLEIGSGLGVLACLTSRQASLVIALEIDRRFIPLCQKVINDSDCGRVIIRQADFLKIDIAGLLRDCGLKGKANVKVAGNLPYYASSPIIVKLFDARRFFDEAVIMLQKEVAQRLTAACGSKAYGVLSVILQTYCRLDYLKDVSKESFFPRPDVDSALIRLKFLDKPKYTVKDEGVFCRAVKAAFSKRRKTLLNALSTSPHIKLSRQETKNILQRARINPAARAEELEPADFAALANLLT